MPGEGGGVVMIFCTSSLHRCRVACRDVGSISNLGAQHFEGTFSLRKKGHFLRIIRALLC